MIPDGDVMRCKSCGAVKEKADDEAMKSVQEKEGRDMVIIEEKVDINTLPTAEVECDECGHDEAVWWLRQMRSADESETRFFRCTNCENTWREYD